MKHPKRIPAHKIVAEGQPTQFGWVKRPSLVTCQHGFVLDPGEECAECGDRDAVVAASNADFDRPLDVAALVARFDASIEAPPVTASTSVPQYSNRAGRPITPKQVDYLMAWWDHLTPQHVKDTPGARTAANGRALAMTSVEASQKLSDLIAKHGSLPRRTSA